MSDETSFRARVIEFLQATCQLRTDLGEAGMSRDQLAGRAFQRNLFDAGLAGLTVPEEYGGAGLTKRHQEIFNEEAAPYFLPSSQIFIITHGMCVPTLLALASEDQKRTHIAMMLRGEHIWCQMFSEPGAGSDLASLQMRADRDGEEWVLNGQKVWTSSAHYADYAMCVARTDPAVPKHQGLSMFIVPMNTSGIEVRPLRQMTGDTGFNEVFCTDARIPAANIIGASGDGWRGAITMLMNERVALGASNNSSNQGRSDVLQAMARATGASRESSVRQQLADLYIREEIQGYLARRTRAAVQAGRAPGPEGSIAKLSMSEIIRRATGLALSLGFEGGVAWSPDDHDAATHVKAFLQMPSFAIAGGSSEVQRNIIGERVLGLPKEPEVDRTVPFNQLLVGTQTKRA